MTAGITHWFTCTKQVFFNFLEIYILSVSHMCLITNSEFIKCRTTSANHSIFISFSTIKFSDEIRVVWPFFGIKWGACVGTPIEFEIRWTALFLFHWWKHENSLQFQIHRHVVLPDAKYESTFKAVHYYNSKNGFCTVMYIFMHVNFRY